MLRRLFISLLALVGATLGGAVAGPGTAQAQGSDVDLAVSIEVPAMANSQDDAGPTITLTNSGSDPAYAVEVVIEADNISLDPTSNSTPGKITVPPIGSVALRDSKLIWRINRLPGRSFYQYTVFTGHTTGTKVVQYVATVSSRSALEPEGLRHDNRTEVWQVRFNQISRAAYPAYAVTVAVDDRSPAEQGDVTFTVVAAHTSNINIDRAHLRDAQVTIPLPEGLTYESHTTTPTGTSSYNSITEIWTIGNWHPTSAPVSQTRSLTLTATRAANTVLNEQCVTAEISAKPPEPLARTANNRTTFCLGAPPDEPVLFQSGDVELWTPYPCVGKTTYPCTTDDTVEVVTVSTIEKWGSGQIIKSSPEKVNVFIQVDPVGGRTVDTHAHSVSTVSWQTKKTETHGGTTTVLVPGVQIGWVRKHLKVANWHQIIRTVSVSGVIAPTASDQTCNTNDPSPPCPPGYMKIRSNNSGNAFFDPKPTEDYSHTRNPFNPSTDSDTFSKYFAEFATLGTYVVDFKTQVTNKDTTNHPNPFSGTLRSIFHVGPIAELAVRDASPNPAVPSSQRAFTIMALNNGPDAAPAQVAVDLQGATVSQAIASQGSYDRATGIWTIGALPVNGPTTAPTLTLLTTAIVDTPITATITNTEDYQVCISSTGTDLSHTTEATCDSRHRCQLAHRQILRLQERQQHLHRNRAGGNTGGIHREHHRASGTPQTGGLLLPGLAPGQPLGR